MVVSKNHILEVWKLYGYVEDSQKLWIGQLVKHDLMLFCSFLPWLIENLEYINLLKTFEMLGNKLTGR